MFDNLSVQDKLLSCKFLLHLPKLNPVHRKRLARLLDDVGLLSQDNIPFKYENKEILSQIDSRLTSIGWEDYNDWQSDLLESVGSELW